MSFGIQRGLFSFRQEELAPKTADQAGGCSGYCVDSKVSVTAVAGRAFDRTLGNFARDGDAAARGVAVARFHTGAA